MSTITATKPVYAIREPVAFEVELPSVPGSDDQAEYLWAIVVDDDETDLVHEDTITQRRGGPTQFTLLAPGSLDPGSYHVRLYNKEDVPSGFPYDSVPQPPYWTTEPDAEDSFAVAGEPTQQVMLVPGGGHEEGARDFGLPTLKGFEDMLKHVDLYETDFWKIKKKARNYVKRLTCESIFDLVPPGYLEGRAQVLDLQGVDWSERQLPCVELIWNYFEEEGMLVQTLNVILARFQNRRLGPDYDALARFDVTPLLPLRNLLWGWAEDEINRMTLRRRAAEYEYEYGLTMVGKAVPPPSTVVERRSGFLEAFHKVIHQAHTYYRDADDLTRRADPFPLFQSLRDCHLILSAGSHNQYGQLAQAARVEFLLMQLILAQPEMRTFLGGRPMTPYEEDWMDRVDTMKALQGWGGTSVMHFHDLATTAERLVLTIRLGNWNKGGLAGGAAAAAWANAFRSDIYRYVAAYQTATGVDLMEAPDATMPSALLSRRARTPRLHV